MPSSFKTARRFAQRMKDNYPPGTRIMLLSMDDPYAPVPEGTKGTVLIKAAEQETTVEEIVEQAIRKYIERNGENAL